MKRSDGKFPDNGFEGWGGYMQAKIAKLEEQFTAKSDSEDNKLSDIFNGVSIYVNGYTTPTADELKVLMCRHGGIYHTYQRCDDYIIASNLPDTKVKNMSLAKVVKPEWITESIKLNKLLNYRDYLLYKSSKSQLKLNFMKIPKHEDMSETSVHQSIDWLNKPECTENTVIHQSEDCVSKSECTEDVHIPIPQESEDQIICSMLQENASNKINNPIKLPTVITKTAADPNFIAEFYNNSRLHHISQLSACFKQYVNDLRDASHFKFPMRSNLKEKIVDGLTSSQLQFDGGKTIMHIDMDCFFVSVGLRTHPELRGQPVAVTHSKGGQYQPKRPGVNRATEFNMYRQRQVKKLGKVIGDPEQEITFESRIDNVSDENDKFGSMSEIASCSYEARAKGITNGMFMGPALKLCPELKTIPYNFDAYKDVAYTLYNTIAQYTLDIEAVSCDEMYVDCTDLLKESGINANDLANILRDEIKTKTGCPCSTGFGGNRLQARLATKRAKPNGQFFLTHDLLEDFMVEVKVKDLPGVGRQIHHKLASLGQVNCGSLQSLPLSYLQSQFGMKTGAQLFDQCRGKDKYPLQFHRMRKSVSAEVNYGVRFDNMDQCQTFLSQLSAEVCLRLHNSKVLGKCITLKLMVRADDAPVETAKFLGHGVCNVINKSTSLLGATDNSKIITQEVMALFKKQKIDPRELRGVGVQITKLESAQVKQREGAMSKFLSHNLTKGKDPRTSCASTHSEADKLYFNHTAAANQVKELITTENNKSYLSPSKKSPTKALTGRRLGRPPKTPSKKDKSPRSLLLTKNMPFKSPLPKVHVSKESSLQLERVPEESGKGLLSLTWEKVRELLRAWIENGQAPLSCDIDLISAYMCQMVADRNISNLHILLKFLKRRTQGVSVPEWEAVYKHVMEQIQNMMLKIYGRTLYTEEY